MPETMPETPLPVVWITSPNAVCWDSTEAARLIAGPGLSVETAQRQIRRFAQQGWMPVARQRGNGPKAANLFGRAAVAAAKVLSVLTDLGIESHETMGQASVPLLAWNNDQPIIKAPKDKSYGSPIVAAMMRAETHGEWWVYQLRLLRGDQTGKRQVRAWVYDPEAWNPSGEAADSDMLPRAAITLQLVPLLLPVVRRMRESVGVTSDAAN